MKDFDIFLNNRLTECDVIVYSIPYRDGLTVMNRLILESCLESYILQKFVAVHFGSELVSHIDEMIKTCYERLHFGVKLDVSAEFQTHYTLYPSDKSGIEIALEKIKTLAVSFTDAENALQIASAPLLAQIAKSPGRGSSGLELEQSVRDTLKTSIEEFSSGMQILSDVAGTVKHGCESVDVETVICSELTDLCYRFYAAVGTTIQIVAEVLGTELHYSLGNGESAVVIGAEIPDGDCAAKYEAVSGVVSVLADVIESITQFVTPPEHKTVILSEVEAIKRRYRLLYELDPDDLDAYAGTNHNAPANKTVSVTAELVPAKAALNSMSWSDISKVAEAGLASSYWSVGDTKTITINGKAGNFTFSNLSIDVFIIGFNHNPDREGNNRIHFQIGKISGKTVALCDSQYNSSTTSSGYFNMNTSNTNSGVWNGSYMRKTLLGNSNTPASPLANSLIAALPSDLRAVMKGVTQSTATTREAAQIQRPM